MSCGQIQARLRNGELCGKWVEDLEPSVPLKAWRVEVFVGVCVVAHSADIVGHEAARRHRHLVVGHYGIVGFAEAIFVDECEVAHIEKTFDLPATAASMVTLSGSTCT